jgi:hypothetical protein
MLRLILNTVGKSGGKGRGRGEKKKDFQIRFLLKKVVFLKYSID